MSRLPVANWVLMGLIAVLSIAGWVRPGVYDTLAGLTVVERESRYADQTDEAFAAIDNLRSRLGAERKFTTQEIRTFEPSWWALPLLAVSSSFVHAGVFSFLGNLIFLFLFGNAVNYKFGHAPFLGLFVGTALISGLMFYLTTDGIPLAGANGAIMGITGAFVVFFPRNDVTMAHIMSPWYGTFLMPSWLIILCWFTYDLVSFLAGGQIGMAYVSHLTGLVVGFSVAAALAWRGVIKPEPHEQTLLQLSGLKT